MEANLSQAGRIGKKSFFSKKKQTPSKKILTITKTKNLLAGRMHNIKKNFLAGRIKSVRGPHAARGPCV